MMKVKFKGNEGSENPTLDEPVEPDTDLKNWLVEYVGAKHNPEDLDVTDVTVGMIVETMAEEFPEFLLAVAEENWVRGYQQAFYDFRGDLEKDTDDNEQQT